MRTRLMWKEAKAKVKGGAITLAMIAALAAAERYSRITSAIRDGIMGDREATIEQYNPLRNMSASNVSLADNGAVIHLKDRQIHYIIDDQHGRLDFYGVLSKYGEPDLFFFRKGLYERYCQRFLTVPGGNVKIMDDNLASAIQAEYESLKQIGTREPGRRLDLPTILNWQTLLGIDQDHWINN